MTDLWDFSSLLSNWGTKSPSNAPADESLNDITEQMNKELDDISNQLAISNSNDPVALNSLHLLAPPVSPVSSKEVSVAEDVPRPQQLFQPSTSKLPPLTSKSMAAPLGKPKESMQMRAKQTVISRNTLTSNSPIFKATPDNLKVVNFNLQTDYKLRFTLQNISSHTKNFQIRGPADTAFKFRILENVSQSQIRPGLHITFEVTFTPTQPRDYEGSIIIIPGTNDIPTTISIRCYRDPPQLQLYDVVDLGATLVHSSKGGKFNITNKGGVAYFSFYSVAGRDNSHFYTDGAFSLIPSKFMLKRDESIEIDVKFKPVKTGEHTASFEIKAEHFPQTFSFITHGFAAVPSLRFAICEGTRLFLPFLPEDANQTRSIEIINEADVPYSYHVQVVRPRESVNSILKVLYPDIDTTTVKSKLPPFYVNPVSGLIAAREKFTLNVTFSPKMFAFYRANLVLFANRIPDETGTLVSRKMLTIVTEGTTGPPCVSIQPPLVIFNEVVPRTHSKQEIEVVNDSYLNIKLQWRKSEVISPNPVVFDVKPKQKTPVELCCFLSQRIPSLQNQQSTTIFKHQPQLALQYSSATTSTIPLPLEDNRPPSSQNYAISFHPLANNPPPPLPSAPEETIHEEQNHEQGDDEMPNIFSLKQSSSVSGSTNEIASSVSNAQFQLESENVAHVTDEITIPIDTFTQMTFTYSAHISPPSLVIEPPVLDFDCVLAGRASSRTLTLNNTMSCPIGYSITYPNVPEWTIPQANGVISNKLDIEVILQFNSHTALTDIITINTWWVDKNENPIEALPTAVFEVPVYAVFDRPIIDIKDRVIEIGDVYPTLKYNTSFDITLLNAFPTDFTINNYENPITLESPASVQTTSRPTARTVSSAIQPRVGSLDGTGKLTQRANSQLGSPKRKKSDIEEEEEDHDEEEEKTIPDDDLHVIDYAISKPSTGHLDLKATTTIDVDVCFCELGDHALPLKCNVTGGSYSIAIIAHVNPPNIHLITDSIDFSSDFVICKRSESKVKVENLCGVPSTAQLKMIDDCNGVFSLDDHTLKKIEPMSQVEIPVSCYSEIHGDYNGSLKLIITDPWQFKEIIIPMHVKALGSFFGFQKHTLGYTISMDGDYISFGNAVKIDQGKVIRRLTLENFSSEPIEVNWSLSNFVKGRHYADVDFQVQRSGKITVSIDETPEANVQDPFHILTDQCLIESHGKAIVVVEFTPKEPGVYRGCVAAKSGEFIHSVGLFAEIK